VVEVDKSRSEGKGEDVRGKVKIKKKGGGWRGKRHAESEQRTGTKGNAPTEAAGNPVLLGLRKPPDTSISLRESAEPDGARNI
jgi:hypothetical protein